MRAIVQRINRCALSVDGKQISSCGFGYLVLVGFTIGFAEVGITAALPAAWIYNGVTVGIGELGVCLVLGTILLRAMPQIKFFHDLIPEGRLARA